MLKDLSHLPRTTDDAPGLAPDDDDTFIRLLVDEEANRPSKPKVSETLSRHSAAGDCLKKVALLRDGVETEGFDLSFFHVVSNGTMYHEAWQNALMRWAAQFDSPPIKVSFEVPTTIEDLTSGSCDALLEIPNVTRPTRHVLELKTTGEFSFDKCAGTGRSATAEGPKASHLVQLALNMMGLDADKGTLVYVRWSAISAPQAEKKGLTDTQRFGASWTFTREQMQPLADEWLEFLRWVRDHPTEKVPRFVPFTDMPKGARLNPETGAWAKVEEIDGEATVTDSGAIWGGSMCLHYCQAAEACKKQYAEGK